jgi:hypothetical protein
MAATGVYHKGYTPAERLAAQRACMRNKRAEDRINNLLDKEVIVWDGEGMKLSGSHKAQHYVLFGCSARPMSPLVIDGPHDRLKFEDIADYCMSVVREHPNAVHLGYFFKYDQNMIIWSLPWPAKQVLYSRGSCMVNRNGAKYYVRCIFGKTLRITRVRADGEKLSILIEDFAPFFASSFVKAYETLFPTPTDPKNWAVVVQGKKDRAVTEYKDLLNVTRYWRAEIMALYELAFEFRRLMFEGGFMLSQWHGPGALANYIRRNNGLLEHEWGGKEQNLSPSLHDAVKGAYFGGHFEQYRLGRIMGPIHAYDVNSAYPSAFREIPSLKEGGQWVHYDAIPMHEWFKRGNTMRSSFGVFRVEYRQGIDSREAMLTRTAQPLPHRAPDKAITYPPITNGWYWTPEVRASATLIRDRVIKDASFKIVEGWVWEPANDNEWPWEDLMNDMYKRRKVLQKNKNPTQMGFKLGMNSLYGKYAQRAGGKEKAPSSHTLPIAGYITSACRALVMRLIHATGADNVISVETDGIFTTTAPEDIQHPEQFPLSNALGEWGHKVYDEMIILQNGIYLLRKGDKWEKAKTRGINASHFENADGETDPKPILDYLASCGPDHIWSPLKFEGREGFIGLGTAIARCTKKTISGKFSTNPFKASDLHCTWVTDPKEVDIEGRKSKRIHNYKKCRACSRGETPDQTWHDMVVHTVAHKHSDSLAYALPWEKGYKEPEWEIMKHLEEAGLTETEPE